MSSKSNIKKDVLFRVSRLNGFNKAFLSFTILKYEYKIQGYSLYDFYADADKNKYDGYYGLYESIINKMLNLY